MVYWLWLLVLVPGQSEAKWEVFDELKSQAQCYERKAELEKRLEETEIPLIVLKCAAKPQKKEGLPS